MTTQVMPSFAGGGVWCPVDGAIIKPYSKKGINLNNLNLHVGPTSLLQATSEMFN